MGANPYAYFTDYDADTQQALEQLRASEFAAGRYEPCFREKTGKYLFEFGFQPRDRVPAPGGCHDTYDALYESMDADGTNSILDIFRAVETPFPHVDDPMMAPDTMERMNTTAPLPESELAEIFGTTQPSGDAIMRTVLAIGKGESEIDVLAKRDRFWSQIGRGQCRHVVAFDGGTPREIFFAGVSFD